ncbi:hypothetical protein ACFFSW_17135 [Saccharothrix longispora]|uniref:Uncharacterized protein n=1 Tax=Saccharothrix longispora TaxID=33920 RepID=A0ABU1PT53_9PSEU|nr:hypothetical protein [Saccharothrix longispora]MDR6593631.1 hypothetical protein [Saccharothrix longispora]
MSRGFFRATSLLCAVALAAVACTGAPSDQPTSTSTPDPSGQAKINPSIPEDLRSTAEAYAHYREIDACALHDPAAAEKASGEGSTADELMPSDDGFDTCTLRLHKSEFNSTWTMYLRVAREYDVALRHEAALEQIGGVEFYVKEEGAPLPSCELARPLDDTYAVVLDVHPDDRNNVVRPVCDFTRDYVEQVADRWRDLPRHGAGHTQPALPLALRDPCQALIAVVDDFGPDVEIKPREVYECSIGPGSGGTGNPTGKSAAGEVTVVYGVAEHPARNLAVSPDEYQAADITGYQAVTGMRAGQCRTVAVWDPDTAIVEDHRDDDALPAVQIVRIDTPDCEQQSKKLIEKILTAVGAP